MALKAVHKGIEFGVGDTVRVSQVVVEGSKKRSQAFEGMVIAIRGDVRSRNFVVRRIGSQQIGIEKIFPIDAPVIEKIDVIKKGTEGVRRAKLYYTRDVSKKEIEKIYQRTSVKKSAVAQKEAQKRKTSEKKPVKKVKTKKSK